MFKHLCRSIALVSSLLIAAPGHAIVVVDTGPQLPFDSGYILGGGQSLAAEFTVANALALETIEGFFGGNVEQLVTITIFADGGDVPGAPLYSQGFQQMVSPGSWQGLAGLFWTVAPGSYWIGFDGSADDFALNFMPWNAPNPLPNQAILAQPPYYVPTTGIDMGVRITGSLIPSAVPEAATWAAMLLGFAAIGIAMRRGDGARSSIWSPVVAPPAVIMD